MKKKIRVLVVVLLTVALLTALFPVTGLAKENKTYFTGTECFGEITDLGISKPLGNGEVKVTGLHSWHTDTTSDPRLTGKDSVVVNAVSDMVAGNGTFWGTFEIVNDGGSWFGHWVGKQENGSFTIDGLTHGSGGYDGLVANWHYSPETDENGCALTSGYIVEMGGGN
jgi:hypothetical protein